MYGCSLVYSSSQFWCLGVCSCKLLIQEVRVKYFHTETSLISNHPQKGLRESYEMRSNINVSLSILKQLSYKLMRLYAT